MIFQSIDWACNCFSTDAVIHKMSVKQPLMIKVNIQKLVLTFSCSMPLQNQYNIHISRADFTVAITTTHRYKHTNEHTPALLHKAVMQFCFSPIGFYRHYLDLIYALGLRWLFSIYKSDCTKKLCLKKNPAQTTKSNPPINYEGERARESDTAINYASERERARWRSVAESGFTATSGKVNELNKKCLWTTKLAWFIVLSSITQPKNR